MARASYPKYDRSFGEEWKVRSVRRHSPLRTPNQFYAAFTSVTSFDSDAFASPNSMLVAGA